MTDITIDESIIEKIELQKRHSDCDRTCYVIGYIACLNALTGVSYDVLLSDSSIQDVLEKINDDRDLIQRAIEKFCFEKERDVNHD